MAVLVDITGNRVFDAVPGTTVGRSGSCTIRIPGPLVSRIHAEIRRTAFGRLQVVDMGSTHGTWVGGKRVEKHTLSDGDEIIVGASWLRFHSEPPADRRRGGRKRSGGTWPPLPEFCPRLESSWATGAEFLENHLADPKGPGVFFHPIPRNRDLPPDARTGALFLVNVRLLDRNANIFIHARVIRRHASGEKRGLDLEFLDQEHDSQELLLACARGESVPWFRRRHERTECRLPVRVTFGKNERLDSVAIDVSEGGTCLLSDRALDPEAVVTVSISFSKKRRIYVKGRVEWARPYGPQQAAGIEFLFESAGQRDEMSRNVALLRSRRVKSS